MLFDWISSRTRFFEPALFFFGSAVLAIFGGIVTIDGLEAVGEGVRRLMIRIGTANVYIQATLKLVIVSIKAYEHLARPVFSYRNCVNSTPLQLFRSVSRH